jgi:hypothetical protein
LSVTFSISPAHGSSTGQPGQPPSATRYFLGHHADSPPVLETTCGEVWIPGVDWTTDQRAVTCPACRAALDMRLIVDADRNYADG